jgi:hypothetical protein
MNEFDFTTMIPQVNFFFIRFLEETEDTKNLFQNELTFRTLDMSSQNQGIFFSLTSDSILVK